MYIVESGSAAVSLGGEPLGEVAPGDVVGEVAVLASGRRTASVVATTPVRALAWFKRNAERLSLESSLHVVLRTYSRNGD